MKILWYSWKDIGHPAAGGAEKISHNILKNLAKEGNEITLVTSSYKFAENFASLDGYKIFRFGTTYTVFFLNFFYSFKFFARNFSSPSDNFDLVVEEVNTFPFFIKFFPFFCNTKKILFFHQLAREIWFYQMPFPFSFVGYILEPIYLWLLSSQKVITVSESTKKDLMRFGFKPENIFIISEGIELEPVVSLEVVKKFNEPTLLSLGAMRPMKQTLDAVKIFEAAKEKIPNLKFILAGDKSGGYAHKVINYINKSKYRKDIQILGKVKLEDKIKLMRESHFLLVTSVKEGWGLVATEAASQGTPSLVWDVDGLRDSVLDGKTGLVVPKKEYFQAAKKLYETLNNPVKYRELSEAGLAFSKNITFERSYQDFKALVFDTNL